MKPSAREPQSHRATEKQRERERESHKEPERAPKIRKSSQGLRGSYTFPRNFTSA